MKIEVYLPSEVYLPREAYLITSFIEGPMQIDTFNRALGLSSATMNKEHIHLCKLVKMPVRCHG